MPPNGHAFLGASSARRWLNCPPSARLCEQFPDTPSEYAEEGSEAHELCEYRLRNMLGMPAVDPAEHLKRFTEEMAACAENYAEYVIGRVAEAKQRCADPLVLIEQRVDYSRWVPEGFGTADAVIIADAMLEVIDFKFGAGVQVEAAGNPQMQCYALGAYAIFSNLYDIACVRMTIYQPRRDNIAAYELPITELLIWGEKVLAPAAELAFSGKGEFQAGGWCRFCRAKIVCRARAEANLALARHDFALPATLEDAEIEVILCKLNGLKAWVDDIQEYALRKAISGKEWSGWKLVEGRSNRQYADESAVADAVSKAGFDPYEKSLLGITAMQKRIGKKRFDELLSGLLVKPKGKPTLVQDTDSRQPFSSAKADFIEEHHD